MNSRAKPPSKNPENAIGYIIERTGSHCGYMTDILWVEDQFHWIDKLSPTLESADFGDARPPNKLMVFKFADAACQYIRRAARAPDIAILDANMNGNDEAGFTVSRALTRKWPDLPIIYLSEHSGTGIEQQALEQMETRDFIAKHQQNIEAILCWRIKAALRQAALQKNAGALDPNDWIRSGDLSIDLSSWDVFWHGQKLMNPKNCRRPLAPVPRKILRFLVEASPRPLSTLQIAERLDSENFNYATYRQHIRTLRQAFEQAGEQSAHPGFIELCKLGEGVVTFGDEGAYCWKPVTGAKTQ